VSHKYASFVRRFRFAIVAVWLVAAVATGIWLPNLASVVASQKSSYLPANASVNVAQNWLDSVDPAQQATSTALIALHQSGGLSAADNRYFEKKLGTIAQDKAQYGVLNVEDAYDTPTAVASSFHSADKTTDIALIGFPGGDVSTATKDALAKLHTVMSQPPSGAQLYFTGDAPIQQDETTISQQGVEKTAAVTVVLVLVILLLVFRSVLAPLLTLLAIGLSFFISSGIVAWLAQRGLPSSTFTQTFLIAVLFGAGTDYTIILLNRYREELTKSHDTVHALAQSLRAVSKTMAFSASTVFVSFAVLYFTRFGLYRSAVGVSVGIAVALIACLSFVPALMAIFGRHLYWPKRPLPGASHPQSRLWGFTGGVAVRRPWLTLLALVVVLAPIASLFTNTRTFDPLADIPSAPSAKGFHVVSQAFGPGHALPMQLVLRTPDNLRSSQGLATIAQITAAVAHLTAVDEVQSATAPAGTPIASFTLAHQNQLAAQGLTKINTGLSTLGQGLTTTGEKMTASLGQSAQLVRGAQQVASGTASLHTADATIAAQMSRYASGVSQWRQGATSFSAGLQKLTAGTASIEQGSAKLTGGLGKLANGAVTESGGLSQLSGADAKLSQAAKELANALAQWAKAHPGQTSGPQWQQIMALAQGTDQGLLHTTGAASALSQGATQMAGGLQGAVRGSQSLTAGLKSLQSGATAVQAGASRLSLAAGKLASGAQSLAGADQQIAGAAGTLAAGSSQVAGGVRQTQGQLGTLGRGLTAAGQGAVKLSRGTHQVGTFLTGTSTASTQGNPGFYVPATQIQSNASLQKALKVYISKDGHTAEFTVILKANPFSMTAIQQMPELLQAARLALQASPIHTGTILGAGTTPTQAALNSISTQDFTHAVTLILVAIFLLLVVMLRSILTPLYILASLAGTYFVTMGLLQTIVMRLMHETGISWTVPFFVFLLLVALGVDYSIFLMSRFEEELGDGTRVTPAQAMHSAMRHMGNVILSAALIMGGTFGSMSVSGVTSLVEIGLSIIIGLGLYTTVIMGLFIPSVAAVFGRGHFWPFRPHALRGTDSDGTDGAPVGVLTAGASHTLAGGTGGTRPVVDL